MVTKRIYLKSSDEALRILGQQDENMRSLENKYGVQIFVRQGGAHGDFSLVVRGAGLKVDRAVGEIEGLRAAPEPSTRPEPAARQPFAAPSRAQAVEPAFFALPAKTPMSPDTVYVTVQGKRIVPRSAHQKNYVESVLSHDMVIAVGPAGTGKTFLAVACALRALQNGKVNRIVLTRPVVEAGERLGFLPGDLYEKINPYLKPLYDAFYSMIGPERFRFFREEETVEIVPLAYMRGRTIDNAFIILDEAQNTTPEQIKMFLTRMGSNSKMIVTGDPTQTDLLDRKQSGLVVAEKILSGIEGIDFVRFSDEDVVRHALVKKIINAYDAADKKPAGGPK